MEDRRILSSEEKAEDLEAHVALIAQEFRAGFEAADRIDPVGCQNSVTGCKSMIFRDVDRVLTPTRDSGFGMTPATGSGHILVTQPRDLG